MKLSNIRDILAVAECGSLRAASRKLGITQPTMTRSIRDTEHELGLELFKRSRNGVTLTDTGSMFVRRAAVIQNELRKITEESQQAQGDYQGQVSVAMSAAASIALIPKILGPFERRYPKALMKLTESLFKPVEADLYSGSIDLFIGPYQSKVQNTSLQVDFLFETKRIIVARKGHPLSKATSLSMLTGARWIKPSFFQGQDETDLLAPFEQSGLPNPTIVSNTHSTMMTLLAVANSDSLAIIPRQWLDLPLSEQSLQALPVKEVISSAPICIVRRRDVPLTPLAQGFYDIVERASAHYHFKEGERTSKAPRLVIA